jgi:radical SAM superfamily enzyme YgiQ (UPF0313 family)
MRIAVIATYTHPTRQRVKERSFMQSAVPELIAGLCPDHAEVEVFNEKERDIPLDRYWDLIFFSYLHSYYEHTKVLSTFFKKKGAMTVAGGRHASYFHQDCLKYFDSVIVGEPEASVPELIRDFEKGQMKRLYRSVCGNLPRIEPYRYDLIDFHTNRNRLPGIEASRGCPFSCNFCVLTKRETYRCRPIRDVVEEIQFKMRWNQNYFGLLDNKFGFLDNNLGGSLKYLKELCEALLPLKKNWGCSLSFDVLRNGELVKLMAKAGCRYVYTGLESLNPGSLESMNKGQNRIKELDAIIRRAFANGIFLSFGLLVSFDGDTNDYLENLPKHLADLSFFSTTFVGIVCPFPETPFFSQLKSEGRILPGTISRDLDGYTLCHRPRKVAPSELVEHFQRLCLQLGGLRNIAKHYVARLGLSSNIGYRTAILFTGFEVASIRNPVKNRTRRYLAGSDTIEEWDTQMMRALGISPQVIS